ncbi:MAG: hypothetical protein ACKVQT_14850 [Burkholderiales bacterium]
MNPHLTIMTKLIAFFWQSGKIPAFLIHLTISAALVFSLAAMVYLVWYPPPYFEYDGASNIMRVVIFVDLILGPLLTMVVFRRGKKELKRDLGIIASIQLVAFVCGAGLMMQYRPAFVVYADDTFYAVRWPDVAAHTKDHARLEQMRTSIGPTAVVLELPVDSEQRKSLLNELANGGPVVTLMGDYYQPMTPERWRAIVAKSVDIDAQARAQPEFAEAVARFRMRFLDNTGMTIEKLAFYQAFLRNGLVIFAMDRESGVLFGWLN